MRNAEIETTQIRRAKRTDQFDPQVEASGLFGSIRHALATTVGVLHSRMELLTLELKETKGRVFSIVIWGLALVFMAFLTMVSIMALVTFLLWEQRLAVLAGFSGFFIVLAVASFLSAKSKLGKIPLGDTVDQLKKDRDLIKRELS